MGMRKIVKIDEDKCNGCGSCVPACAEGALQVIDGKARLVSETYCDGLGACLGECPQGAITIEERPSQEFDEEAARRHVELVSRAKTACACPGAAVRQFERRASTAEATESAPSMLAQWPVQLALVPPAAPFLKGADIMLSADCVPFACADFHRRFLPDHALLVACPKLDDFAAHLEKLTAIMREAAPNSLTVVNMEVPCCFGLVHMARESVRLSGRDVPVREVTIGIRGEPIQHGED